MLGPLLLDILNDGVLSLPIPRGMQTIGYADERNASNWSYVYGDVNYNRIPLRYLGVMIGAKTNFKANVDRAGEKAAQANTDYAGI